MNARTTIILILACFVWLWLGGGLPAQDRRELEKRLPHTSGRERIALLLQLADACLDDAPESAVRYAAEAERKGQGSDKIRAQLHLAAAENQIRPSQAVAWGERAVDAARAAGDRVLLAEALIQRGTAYERTRRNPAALADYQEAHRIYEEKGDEHGLTSALLMLGNIAWLEDDYHRATALYRQALGLSRKHDLKLQSSQILLDLGNISIREARFEEGLQLFLESLKLKEALNQRTGIANVLNNISVIYYKMGDYEKALEYMKRALDLARQTGNRVSQARFLLNIASTLRNLGRPMEALQFNREVAALAAELNDPAILAQSRNNMAHAFVESGDLPAAEAAVREAITIKEKLGNPVSLAESYFTLGRVCLQMGRYPQALEYFGRSLRIAERKEVHDLRMRNYMFISDTYSRSGETAKALQSYRLFNTVREKLIGNTVAVRISDLQLRYAVEKVEGRMRALEERKRRQARLYISIAAVLLLLAAGLLINRYRLKRQAGRLLRRKDEEIADHRDRIHGLNEQLQEYFRQKSRKKYENSPLGAEEAEAGQRKLLHCMEREKPYLDAELTLAGLAERIDLSAKALSQIINERLQRNFSDFVNHYRVEEAKTLLRQTAPTWQSVLDIAFEVGFNSKSSFNTVFKKHTGLTPSQFRQDHLANG